MFGVVNDAGELTGMGWVFGTSVDGCGIGFGVPGWLNFPVGTLITVPVPNLIAVACPVCVGAGEPPVAGDCETGVGVVPVVVVVVVEPVVLVCL